MKKIRVKRNNKRVKVEVHMKRLMWLMMLSAVMIGSGCATKRSASTDTKEVLRKSEPVVSAPGTGVVPSTTGASVPAVTTPGQAGSTTSAAPAAPANTGNQV